MLCRINNLKRTPHLTINLTITVEELNSYAKIYEISLVSYCMLREYLVNFYILIVSKIGKYYLIKSCNVSYGVPSLNYGGCILRKRQIYILEDR